MVYEKMPFKEIVNGQTDDDDADVDDDDDGRRPIKKALSEPSVRVSKQTGDINAEMSPLRFSFQFKVYK